MRGKIASFFTTLAPALVSPQTSPSCQVALVKSMPICSDTLPLNKGIAGEASTVAMRITSNKLYKTVPKRSFWLSSLAKIQGAVSSIYLLALPTNCQIVLKASENASLSKASAALGAVAKANSFNSSSNSVACPASGIMPPKYLSTIATERLTRLPKSLAKSVLMRLTKASSE